MPQQQWVTDSLGGYLANPVLSAKWRMAAAPMTRLRQFCTIKEAFGKGKGDAVNFVKVSNLTFADATLTETATLDPDAVTMTQGTLSINEYGKMVAYTGKLEALASISVRDVSIKALKTHQVEALEIAVESALDACKVRYVASTSTSGNFYTNGTATATASATLNAYHVKQIVDYMMGTMKVPPLSGGEDYMAVCSVAAFRGLYDDLEDVMQYTKFPANGEVGKYYGTRFVRTNSVALDNTIGVGNCTGEGYFFGDDAVLEAVALPEELRFEVRDLGRLKLLGWIAYLGFKIIWEGDPDNRVVKFDSA